MQKWLAITCIFLTTSLSAQLRFNLEGGGCTLAGLSFNADYTFSLKEGGRSLLIPKMGIGHTFNGKALLGEVGLAYGYHIGAGVLKFSADLGITIQSPFYDNGSWHDDLYSEYYNTGDAIFLHIGPEFEKEWERIHISLGLGPVFEFSNPFQNERSETTFRVGAWPKLCIGFKP